MALKQLLLMAFLLLLPLALVLLQIHTSLSQELSPSPSPTFAPSPIPTGILHRLIVQLFVSSMFVSLCVFNNAKQGQLVGLYLYNGSHFHEPYPPTHTKLYSVINHRFIVYSLSVFN